MVTEIEKAEELASLGFTKVSSNLKTLSAKKRKLALAYEHFRFVREEKIRAFNEKLYKERKNNGEYKTLSFTPIEYYEEIPPDHVLTSLLEAKKIGCFDSFEIASIRTVKDPILFGLIDDCSDRFFIDQWDEDVKIEDILMPNEG